MFMCLYLNNFNPVFASTGAKIPKMVSKSESFIRMSESFFFFFFFETGYPNKNKDIWKLGGKEIAHLF